METLLLNGATLIGKGIMSGAITDLYDTLKKSTNHVKYGKIVEELEIQKDIEIVEALLGDLKYTKLSKAIEICVQHIHAVIKEIKDEIDKLNLKIVDHHYSSRASWFRLSSWSPPNCDENIYTLQRLKRKLNGKIDMMIKILSVKDS